MRPLLTLDLDLPEGIEIEMHRIANRFARACLRFKINLIRRWAILKAKFRDWTEKILEREDEEPILCEKGMS